MENTWAEGYEQGCRESAARLAEVKAERDRIEVDQDHWMRIARHHHERRNEAEAERDQLREVLADLVRLKDGPRDDAYRAEKDAAWDRARAALNPPKP